MANDGKKLEDLVAFVESKLLHKGFTVTPRCHVFDDDGALIAELDLEIRGKVGSTDFAWLIECRDRPSAGSAPVSWIEQLVGRRQRFGFNKITAVSTTGFSQAAIDFAKRVDIQIELRAVRDLVPDDVAHWILCTTASVMDCCVVPGECKVWADPAATPNQMRLLGE